MRNRFVLTALLVFVACSEEASKEAPGQEAASLVETCTNVTLGDTGPAWVNWEATKNKNVPVAGRILGEGDFEMPTDKLVGSKLHMKFDPNTVDSEIPLRDERIKTIFFGMDLYPVASYEGRVEFVEGGIDAVPAADGESSQVRINGPLSLAGQTVMLEVHASIERENGALVVKPASRASMIDVKSSGALASNIANLIAAAGVASMERLVNLTDGELVLERACD